MLAQQILSQPMATCQLSDHLDQAAKLMLEHDCGLIMVLDDSGRPVAMLTDRDICMAAYTQGKALGEISIHTAMSQGICACELELPA